jgi:hypothetical protein
MAEKSRCETKVTRRRGSAAPVGLRINRPSDGFCPEEGIHVDDNGPIVT